MTFAKFGFNTGFVLGLIPWKQSLRNLDAYDLLRESSWGKPVKEGGMQDRTTRRQWGQGNRILSLPWTLPHSGTARMTVCGKTQISPGEQLAKAWLGHTLEKHLWRSGCSKNRRAEADVEHLDRLSLGQVTASGLWKEIQEPYGA